MLLSGMALVVAFPLIVVVAVIVALDGSSPFFVQERVGRNGRVFRMLKLRSMVADAESALDGYLASNPGAAREWAERQKLTDDPRVTRFGHFLRRTSLDELPQLINVLKGDMSLVGPRPMMPSQRALYPGEAYYTLRPGITGLWQVSERHGCEFARRADYDQYYKDYLSFGLDLATLMRTVLVVLRGTGC
jgi:lipopolysaccharide/colanic/teichoic acid biosynthesis glycosyltransferase